MATRTALRTGVVAVAAVAAIFLAPRLLNPQVSRGARAITSTSQTPAARPGSFERTPARLARGKYLAENVITCFRCHSQRDWNAPGAPPVAGKEGAGYFFAVGAGPVEPRKPPAVYAANITPDPETGVGRWSDEELARAIRECVARGGVPFPSKYHSAGRNLSDEDVASVIVYLRTFPAVRNPAPAMAKAAPIAETAKPAPPISVPEPVLSDPVRRGEYLVAVADCATCHTADAPNAPLLGKKLAGGRLMSNDPEHYVVTPNITMDASGIGYYDEAIFLRAMRTGKVTARKLYPIMPWGYFRNMTDQDLKAIFAFLKTQPTLKHVVDNTESPTYCRLCLQRHGAGDRN